MKSRVVGEVSSRGVVRVEETDLAVSTALEVELAMADGGFWNLGYGLKRSMDGVSNGMVSSG